MICLLQIYRDKNIRITFKEDELLITNQCEDLTGFLHDCVNTIRSRHPRLSMNQIARKLDMSNSSLDRISKKEVREPTFNTALKIVREACVEETVQKFVEKYYPNMTHTMQKVYHGNGHLKFLKSDVEGFLEDPLTYQVMMVASSNEGISHEDLLSEYGRMGLDVVEKLLENGIVHLRDGKYRCVANVNYRQETCQKLMKNLTTHSYDLEAFGDKWNWLSVQYESVNAEKVTEMLHAVMKRANQEIRAIMNDPENQGADVVWAGLSMDTLKKTKSSEKGSEVLQ